VGFTVRSSHVEKAHASSSRSDVNMLRRAIRSFSIGSSGNEGGLRGFISSEAILRRHSENKLWNEAAFRVKMPILHVVKAVQGALELGGSAGLSGPA